MTTSDEQDEHLERLVGELGKRQFSVGSSAVEVLITWSSRIRTIRI